MSLHDDELEEFLREFNNDLERDQEEARKFERRFLFFILGFLAIALLFVLSGCGGDDAHDCRPDFVGPPTAEQQQLPVCET